MAEVHSADHEPPDDAFQAQPAQIVVHLMGRIGLTIHFIAVLGVLIKYHRAKVYF